MTVYAICVDVCDYCVVVDGYMIGVGGVVVVDVAASIPQHNKQQQYII